MPWASVWGVSVQIKGVSWWRQTPNRFFHCARKQKTRGNSIHDVTRALVSVPTAPSQPGHVPETHLGDRSGDFAAFTVLSFTSRPLKAVWVRNIDYLQDSSTVSVWGHVDSRKILSCSAHLHQGYSARRIGYLPSRCFPHPHPRTVVSAWFALLGPQAVRYALNAAPLYPAPHPVFPASVKGNSTKPERDGLQTLIPVQECCWVTRAHKTHFWPIKSMLYPKTWTQTPTTSDNLVIHSLFRFNIFHFSTSTTFFE